MKKHLIIDGSSYAVVDNAESMFFIINDIKFYDYEKKIIQFNQDKSFLKVNLSEINDRRIYYYDYTYKLQLRKFIEDFHCTLDHQYSGIYLIKKTYIMLFNILNCIKNVENNLLLLSRLMINLDTIFIEPKTEKVSLAIIIGDIDIPLNSKIINFINDMILITNDEELKNALINFADNLSKANFGLKDMIKYLETMIREMSYINWDKQEFRQYSENESLSDNSIDNRYNNQYINKKLDAIKNIEIQSNTNNNTNDIAFKGKGKCEITLRIKKKIMDFSLKGLACVVFIAVIIKYTF